MIFAKRSILAAAAMMLISASIPAAAQRTGTRIGRDATSKDGGAAMQILATCTVARWPDFVRNWFALLPGSREEGEFLLKAQDRLSICMDNDRLVLDGMELRFKPRAMRYPVAAAWVRKYLPAGPTTSPLPVDAEPWYVSKLAALTPDLSVDKSLLALQQFGHCVALNEWAGTRALLLSEPDSAEQKVAVGKLIPALGPCLVEDATLTLTPDNLRVILAEPVYHIVSASAAAQR